MITLIKIRTQYLFNHPCGIFWVYLFIPLILFLQAVGLFTEIRYQNEIQYSIQEGINLNSSNSVFGGRSLNASDFALVSDEEEDKNFLKKLNSGIEWTKDENDVINKHIIKLINKNNKYNIQFKKARGIPLFYNLLNNVVGYYDIFKKPYYYHYSYYSPDYNFNKYEYEVFLNLTSFFAKFLVLKSGKSFDQKDLNIKIGLNKYPNSTDKFYSSSIGVCCSFTIVISLYFSLTNYFFIMLMIDEKEKKLTQLLQRQGISTINYFYSWLLSYLVLCFLPFVSFVLFYFALLRYYSYLFILDLILFIFGLFSFSYFFYSLIETTKTGSILIKFVNFTSSVLGFAISFPQCSKITKVLTAFIPQINIYLSSTVIDKILTFPNLTWEEAWLPANKISYMEVLIIKIATIILYLGLSAFIHKYKNSGLGFFKFIQSFFKHVSRDIVQRPLVNEENIISGFEKNFQEYSPLNQQCKAQKDCLSIVNISKRFDDLKAVDDFNWDLFGNEIFCLLGHNGAGKTTLINMISGIFAPTDGDIFYKGKSIITDKTYLFENIGVCQQEDILFEYLTVAQHLQYMCEIKGSKANVDEITDLIKKIGLSEKSACLAKTLSGGQKRKLCAALALIGNSKIILLDEPTSGMDPISKKSLWDFLKNYHKNKIILITTHSLDEAEYLGDKIGIMSDGQFICCGTSSYLKSKYPCGFNINLLINSQVFNDQKKKEIYEKIKIYEPNAQIKIASKSVFSINIQSNNTHIPEMFQLIENSKAEYGIEDYTVASTSLEDVFLKINNKSDLNDMKYSQKEIIAQPNVNLENINISNFSTQLFSQLSRNMLPLYRNKIMIILEYFSGLGIIYVFVFLFRGLIFGLTNSKMDLIDLLGANRAYIYENPSVEGVFKNSYAYSEGSITLKNLIYKPGDIFQLINEAFTEAFAHVAMGSISINEANDNNWETYITGMNQGYIFADTTFVVSAFLKKHFDIDAIIFSSVEEKKEMSIGKNREIDGNTVGVLIIVCIGSVMGYIIYLGGLVNEKIKERKTNIKHLLYLSGSNSFSYWLSFFIIDYFKLLIFTILLIIPIFYVNSTGGYYFLLNVLVIDASSLVFIYFVSFFGSNAESGVKFLFLLILGYIIFIILFTIFAVFLLLINIQLLLYVYNSFADSYNFTIFDFTPVTSMLLSFGRILYGISNHGFDPTHQYGPATYLYTSFIAQGINFVIYLILLILMEKGVLREFLNYIKVTYCISERNFVFSAEQVSDEFLIYNNVHNPLLLNQVDDGNNNIINTNAVNNNVNPPLGGNNNIINTNSNNINASSYGNNNVINTNSNIINAPLYGNNNINTNSNYINAPLYGNNNQVNMNAPLYGNNNQIDMNAPIFGNSNQIDMNAPIFGNNNQIDMNSPIFGNNNQIDNNMKEPLISNNQNSINNLPINKDNYSINNDEINNAIYDLSLPETNLTYGIRKGNPYVNKEKDKLSERNDLTTRIEGLRKTFWFCCKKSVRAINNLNLGLEANEKFGLLGFNGSGKTTTFRAITNEILFDYGKITLFGHDNKKEFEQIRSRVGYCPQENPLFEFMKVREILDFYSNLKTCFIPYQLICEKFGLTKYLDTFCINLSGGNKRKLTFAIAIMNKPTLLLLDEPSTGVDPESRRFMWKNINELSNSGHQYNMILTTHSMEEAEILCDRVSWLKKGSFVCIGNPEKLKLEYSLGYKLHIKFNDQVISQSRDFLGSGNNMGEAFRDISYLVVGFTKYSSYLLNNAMLEPYIRALIECISKINKYTKKITLIEIGKDLSFELILNIKDQEKQFLFTEILNMKNTDNKISEMIISMESLENILTSFR